MGNPNTPKFVLFDEAQLNVQSGATLDEITSALYDLIYDEIAPYDDLGDESIELEWIASERLDTSKHLGWGSHPESSEENDDWTASFTKILADCTSLPAPLIDAYVKSGKKAEIGYWLRHNLETGASFRQGLSRPHEDTLMSLERARVPGFVPSSCYYDSRSEDPCDARPKDFGDGRRILVEMKVNWSW
ncbi:hypothetical protein [Ruegeria arenilitoris]|uniref:hypothetical protein n=1 Tax=Ruegeria arenilitoris TaxID=1173585 RepID=UPI00147EEC6D|nr:hypothetical protein [Ruegeria arenilitoris]